MIILAGGSAPTAAPAQRVRQIAYANQYSQAQFLVGVVAGIIHLSVVDSQYLIILQNLDPANDIRIGFSTVSMAPASGLLIPRNNANFNNPLSRVILAPFQAKTTGPLYAIASGANTPLDCLIFRALNDGES